MAKRQKRVLLALGWYDYQLHQGVEKICAGAWLASLRQPGAEKGHSLGLGRRWRSGVAGRGRRSGEVCQGRQQADGGFPACGVRSRNFPVCSKTMRTRPNWSPTISCRVDSNIFFLLATPPTGLTKNVAKFLNALKQAGHGATWLRWHKSPRV